MGEKMEIKTTILDKYFINRGKGLTHQQALEKARKDAYKVYGKQ